MKLVRVFVLVLTLVALTPNLFAEDVDSTATPCQAGLDQYPCSQECGYTSDTDWVLERLIGFNANPLYATRSAWARPFAVGDVHVLSKKSQNHYFDNSMHWFMWANTDGYVQICFSEELELGPAAIMNANKDLLDRPFEADVYNAHCDGGYLGVSNDFFVYDETPEYDANIQGGQEFVNNVWRRLGALFPFFHEVEVYYLLK